MFFDFKVEIPVKKGKIYRKTIRDATYINYEYARVYKPDKKYNIPKRTTIGRVCEDDPSMMFPNPNFLKYFPDAELPVDLGRADRSSCLRIGTFLVLEQLVRETGIDGILKNIGYDERGVGLFLDLAAYYIVTECNAGQYYPDYAFNHPLFDPKCRIYSDSTVSRFLNEISIDDSVEFQNQWNASRDHRQKIYISYDATNKDCQSGDIDIVEYGHPKDKKEGTMFNYSIAYDTKNREPLFYEEYPGSIVDISELQEMLEKAEGYGYRNAGFILDRGYFSKANIHFMDSHGYDFVIMVKGMRKLVSELVLEVKGSFETKRANFIHRYMTYGITVCRQLFPSDEKKRYFHIYYSSGRATSEIAALEKKLARMARSLKKKEGKRVEVDRSFERYYDLEYENQKEKSGKFLCGIEKYDVIELEISLCGYFCIITSEKMTAKEALELYKSRDCSEKAFRADKSFLGNRCARVHSEESLDGKILVEFAALILRNRMYTKLKDRAEEFDNTPNYMNVAAAIRELEKIEMIRRADGIYTLDHAVTKTQKTILRAFDMNASYVQQMSEKISEKMKNRTKPEETF